MHENMSTNNVTMATIVS